MIVFLCRLLAAFEKLLLVLNFIRIPIALEVDETYAERFCHWKYFQLKVEKSLGGRSALVERT
jgi:hypothetical protein